LLETKKRYETWTLLSVKHLLFLESFNQSDKCSSVFLFHKRILTTTAATTTGNITIFSPSQNGINNFSNSIHLSIQKNQTLDPLCNKFFFNTIWMVCAVTHKFLWPRFLGSPFPKTLLPRPNSGAEYQGYL
jgi:hypothetical protein